MKVKSICIVLTDKCNARCDVCCMKCQPENSQVMDRDMMLRMIDQAAKIKGIEYIGFSGGEAFLYPELLREGICYAKEKGFLTSVATNGFWGSWPWERRIAFFENLPLDKVFFSHDYYHGQYISDETFGDAVNSLRAFDVSFDIGIGETKSHVASQWFRQMGDYKYLTEFHVYPFERIGHAEEMPEDEFFVFPSDGMKYCNNDGILAVRWDGRVYPCCANPVFYTTLTLGNINDSALKDMLENETMRAHTRCLCDPDAFASLAKEHGIETGRLSGCQICGKLFKNGPLDLEELHRVADKVRVGRLLGRKQA